MNRVGSVVGEDHDEGSGGAAMMQISDRKVVTPDPRQALNAVRRLRRSLGGIELPDGVRLEAVRALDEIEEELAMPEPDRGVVTARFARFTELLAGAGAVASAGVSLIRPIRQIAAWVGPIGVPLVAHLA